MSTLYPTPGSWPTTLLSGNSVKNFREMHGAQRRPKAPRLSLASIVKLPRRSLDAIPTSQEHRTAIEIRICHAQACSECGANKILVFLSFALTYLPFFLCLCPHLS